jgi:UDP-N-acetylmuramoyl-L-alanyl-D-glutamate--2,6-diaminopimelate ligase
VKLFELAARVPGAEVESSPEADVCEVVQDSRRAGHGDLFVAVRGERADGHDFACQAARQGSAVALERPVPLPPDVPVLRLANSRWALGLLAAELNNRPARQLLVAGVTGTDGKTTVTHMAAHVLSASGVPAGFLSTVAFDRGTGIEDNLTGLTTLGAPEVQAALAGMVAAGKRAAVIETTSHALTQGRVSACEFDVAAFTNVGHDHLDYHRGWEEYVEAKGKLVDLCRGGWSKGVPKTALLNLDDASYDRLRHRPIERSWTYSLAGEAQVRALDLRAGPDSARFRLAVAGEHAAVRLRTPARFNVANALCAAGICLALGLPLNAVAEGLSGFPGVPGRLEQVELGQPFRVYVDFAHAAGSLANTLAELQAVTPGRLFAVFGSTPRTDHDRPGMGRAAAEGADWFVITTDDPVDEDPAISARDVEEGALSAGLRSGVDYEVVLDRRAAIRQAIGLARAGDAVLLAGKGHERWMLMEGRRKVPWDDRVEAAAALSELGWADSSSAYGGLGADLAEPFP